MSESPVNSLALDGQYLWVGTYDYVSRINLSTGSREIFLKGQRVYSVAVDKDGSIWAGRYDGLFRYDGQSWTQYSKANSNIPDEHIYKIIIDNKGNKWLRTSDVGLVKFDGNTWKSYGKPAVLMKDDYQSPLAIDTAGNAWMGFNNDYNCALAKFDGKSWTLYDTSTVHSNYVTSIVIDPHGTMWAATDNGISKFDGKSWTVDKYKDFVYSGLRTFSIVFDKSGNTWVANNSGLYKSNGSTWTKYTVPTLDGYPNLANDLASDNQGNLWAGTFKGLYKFDGSKWTRQTTCNSAFTDRFFSIAYTDSSRIRWFADDNGLVKFDGTNWTLYDTTNGLPAVRVSSIAFDKDGTKWFGSYKGLIKYDDNTFTVYKLPDAAGQFYNIPGLAIDPNGIKWLATANHKLLRFDGTNWTIYTSTNSKLPGGSLNYGIYIDRSGTKWFPTEYGIVSFDDKTWGVYNPNEPGSYFSVEKILMDLQGVIWTYGGGGINKFDGNNWTSVYLSDLGMPYESPRFLAIDNLGIKWIATGRGLIRYDGTNANIFNKSNSGLLENEIRTVSTDAAGNKYISYTNISALTVYNEDSVSTAVTAKENELPEDYNLRQNYPNPFNPSTTISYFIPKISFVELKVYDMLGREVTTLVRSLQNTGEYKVQFDASSLPSGMYIYSIQAGEFRASKKFLLIK